MREGVREGVNDWQCEREITRTEKAEPKKAQPKRVSEKAVSEKAV